MDLDIQLDEKEKHDNQRVLDAQNKQKDAKYIPTWQEVWVTGWTRRTTGNHKKGIFETKLSKKDKERLTEVKEAIEQGLISVGVDNLRDFSKTHALKLHAQVKEIKRDKVVQHMKKTKPDNYHIVTDYSEMNRLAELTAEEIEDGDGVIVLDTETTGLTWEDTTVGLSITLPNNDTHFYIPYEHNKRYKQLKKAYVIDTFQPLLEDEKTKLVLHNSKFDVHMLDKDGMDLKDNVYFDTQIAMHVLNENENRYALKSLANKYGKYFNYHDESLSFEELFGKDPKHFIDADLEIAGIYACKDTHLTYLLYKWQLSMMEKQKNLYDVYFNIEQPNTKVAIEMERNGFAIDMDFSRQYRKELEEEVRRLEGVMRGNWGDVNVNSPAQLKELFFDKLGYEDISGKGSVNKSVLSKLAKEHEDVQTLLDYRDVNKLLSTYIEPLPRLVRKDIPEKGIKGDRRLHGSFNQTGTVTGRWSSNDPNLQNFPQRARNIVVAPEGKLMIGIDYSQIEPRTLAHMSGSEKFARPYKEGDDLYVQIASDVYGIPYEHCLESDDTYWREHTSLSKHPRKLAKVILLAVMYGIAPFSLAGMINATVEEAEQFINDFYRSYPVVRQFMDRTVDFVNENGYVHTMYGRKRRFIGHQDTARKYLAAEQKAKSMLGVDELPSSIWKTDLPYKTKKQFSSVAGSYKKVERMSVNARIQGSAADILKLAMVDVYRHLENKDGWKVLATVHDELLFEVPADVTAEEIKELEDIMKNVVDLSVPLKVDTEVMTRWGDGIPKEEWIENGLGREQFG